MKKYHIALLICLLSLASISLASTVLIKNGFAEVKTASSQPSVRIAIYNEPNTTRPAYDDTGLSVLSNSSAKIAEILESFGFSVDLLTLKDIQNHMLTTASYDVLVIPDTEPRENITNYVLEYWLGGGGILGFDSWAVYACYAGILPPEAKGSSGYNNYWSYVYVDYINVTARHPVSKNYHVGDAIYIGHGIAVWNWTALMTSNIADSLTKIAHNGNNEDEVTVLAFDPSDRGGKVVHVCWDGKVPADPSDLYQMIADAVEWLCPHPKGRILFDLSHAPYYGVDPWDDPAHIAGKYTMWRDLLVNHTFTFDKLYPSAEGNITADRLEPYDVLVIVAPQLNFSADEVATVTNWIANGGSLLALGDNKNVDAVNEHINYLLSSLDLSMNITQGSSGVYAIYEKHPVTEGCEYISLNAPGYVIYTGDAYPIWGNDTIKMVAAAQEYGDGRVLLVSDINFVEDDRIGEEDNAQFALNTANWLTACKAKVLAFVDQDIFSPDPNDNIYRGPVASALNHLGIKYLLTFEPEYFNLSLMENSWKLVIIDNAYLGSLFGSDAYTDEILYYVKSGGCLILSTWEYHHSENNQLWAYLGFEYGGNTYVSPPPIYVWNTTHPIFTSPNLYTASNITTSWDYVNVDCANVTIYDNATAIAGLSPSPSKTNATIILGANGRAIVNTMLLTEYYDDTDDSTYPDAFEIWENEIDYMFKRCTDDTPPTIGTPVQEPSTPMANETVTIRVNVTDNLSGVAKVVLSYKVDEGEWTNITMSNVSGDTYEGEIPGLPECHWVYYRIIAYDNAGNVQVEDNAGTYYVYHVIPEFSVWAFIILTLSTSVFLLLSYRRKPKN